MKSIKLQFAFLGVILLLSTGSYFLVQEWLRTEQMKLAPGQQPLQAKQYSFEDQSFDVVKVDPNEFEVRLFWKDENGDPYEDFSTLRESLEAEGRHLRFATNAGIFSEDHTPGGLHVEDGSVLKNLNLRDGKGNFHMKPNGVFILGTEGAGVMESETYQQTHPEAQVATQSGPMLVIDDNLHPDFNQGSTNRYIRNGVGVDKDGNIYFAISNERVNFYDFASLFRDKLDCPDALYLDGSISEFYCPELDRTPSGGEFCGILAVVD